MITVKSLKIAAAISLKKNILTYSVSLFTSDKQN